MNSYILLRNNTETGPFSLEGLQQAGLKATDLIWVECQSMSWRHPHEITELKGLVNGESNTAAVKNEEQSAHVIKDDAIIADVPVEKKLVFVELPAKTNPAAKKVKTVFPDQDISDIRKFGGITDPETLGDEKEEIINDEPNIKYSRSLDEIKELYVKNLQQKKQFRKNISFTIPPKYRQPIIYTCLVLAGAGIMLIIKGAGSKKETTPLQNIQQPIASSVTEPTADDATQANVTIPSEQNEMPAENTQIFTPDDKPKETPVKRNVSTQPEEIQAPEAITKPEKNIQVSNENTVPKSASTENVSSKLSVHANEYVVGSFGGIRNLEMTLQNKSSYLLDKVTVAIDYLNPEGIIIKTDNIYFQSIPAGEKETVAVKKTKRGVKISYKIVKIESKDIGSSTAGL